MSVTFVEGWIGGVWVGPGPGPEDESELDADERPTLLRVDALLMTGESVTFDEADAWNSRASACK